MSWLRVRCAVAVAIAVATPLAACGGSEDPEPPPGVADDQRAILATVDALQTASREGDARKICEEIFTPGLARSIRRSSGRGCPAEVRRTLTSPDAQLSVARTIDIEGSRATTTVREQNGNTSTVRFAKVGDAWRIERVTPLKTP